MQDELRQAQKVMDELLSAAPVVKFLAARVPLVMFERGYPKLIGEGLLSRQETSALVEYVMRVEALNRALDQAGQAFTVNHTSGMNQQLSLAMDSAKRVLKEERRDMGEQSVFAVVEHAVARLQKRLNLPFADSVARVIYRLSELRRIRHATD